VQKQHFRLLYRHEYFKNSTKDSTLIEQL